MMIYGWSPSKKLTFHELGYFSQGEPMKISKDMTSAREASLFRSYRGYTPGTRDGNAST